MQLRLHLVPVVLTALVALTAPAAAIFIETPLRLSADRTEVEVGDKVSFDAEPANESSREHFAGADVIVRWTRLDENASAEDPRLLRDDLRLDDQGRVAFEWTIPADADDHNVIVTIERNEEILGQVLLNVGDAEPLLMAMSGEAPDPRPEQRADDEEQQKGGDAPGAGLFLTLLVLGLAVVAVAARRA